MPKLKTHKGARARFTVTGSGKVMRMKAHKSHLRRKKANRSKGLFDAKLVVSPADVRMVRRSVPYLGRH
ncbi:MAG: 50S ribosomal protein L35 [Chloroflexi bacterium]|nr:50S ribosomal protein L35 [Chloroflexota bacterium]